MDDEDASEDLNVLSRRIIGAAYEVGNSPGTGFLEKVYERALEIELKRRGLTVASQLSLPVHYKGVEIGVYCPDLLVQNRIIVELKCVQQLNQEHWAQCINYLKVTGMGLALLMNYQYSKVQIKRIIRN